MKKRILPIVLIAAAVAALWAYKGGEESGAEAEAEEEDAQ